MVDRRKYNQKFPDYINHSSPIKSKVTITKKTIIPIAISIAIITFSSSAISYFQVISALRTQALEQLEKYVLERGEREKSIFKLAEDNHAVLKQELLRRLQETRNQDPKDRFEKLAVRSKDGVIRNRPEIFDGRQQSGIYIDKSLKIDADIRRRVTSFYDLLNSYGRAWHNRFQNTYISTPENMIVGYWPDFPTWFQDAPADLYMPNEEYVWVADRKHNPARKTVWTGVFYDKVAKMWMVSCATPVDIGERQIATIGHDITLNNLLERTVNDHVEGAYNLIFREDGRLIAHPKLMNKIQEKNGVFNIVDSGDANLQQIFKLIKDNRSSRVIIDSNLEDIYLAVTKIEGPDWYFVTVFPKSVLVGKAVGVARLIVILGMISIAIVVAVVFFVLHQQITAPLKQLISATNQITEGDFNISLEETRQDELGSLARSFNMMAKEVEARTKELQSALEQQAIAVGQTTTTMDELRASSQKSAEQAELSATGAQQVLVLAEAGTTAVGNTLSDMAALKAKVDAIAKQILDLTQQTKQIGNISVLVTEFANQTNMLSLNAAVEAVRAGDSGKGFAVIAGEIRKLAEQSKKSAEKIKILVEDIQNAINATVMVTNEGTKKVEQGVKTARETADTFERVTAAINNIVTSSQQISLTAKQQALAIEQVVEAMNSLNQRKNFN